SPAITDPTAQIVCSANPSTLPGSGTAANVTVIGNTEGQICAMSGPPHSGPNGSPMLASVVGFSALPLIGMLLLPGRKRRVRTLKICSSICLLLLLSTFQVAFEKHGGGVCV